MKTHVEHDTFVRSSWTFFFLFINSFNLFRLSISFFFFKSAQSHSPNYFENVSFFKLLWMNKKLFAFFRNFYGKQKLSLLSDPYVPIVYVFAHFTQNNSFGLLLSIVNCIVLIKIGKERHWWLLNVLPGF